MIQRTYNVPLRREFLRSPRYKRAKKAIIALRKFLQKHMKSEDVLIGRRLNEQVWLHGIKNPPHHVKVDVVKEDDGKVYAELSGFKYEKPIVEEEKKKGNEETKKEAKKGEGIIKEELEKLEEKTEKIKEDKSKKGEEKEKKLEDLSKKEGKAPSARGKTVVEMTEKKRKERQASSS